MENPSKRKDLFFFSFLKNIHPPESTRHRKPSMVCGASTDLPCPLSPDPASKYQKQDDGTSRHEAPTLLFPDRHPSRGILIERMRLD